MVLGRPFLVSGFDYDSGLSQEMLHRMDVRRWPRRAPLGPMLRAEPLRGRGFSGFGLQRGRRLAKLDGALVVSREDKPKESCPMGDGQKGITWHFNED